MALSKKARIWSRFAGEWFVRVPWLAAWFTALALFYTFAHKKDWGDWFIMALEWLFALLQWGIWLWTYRHRRGEPYREAVRERYLKELQ